MRVDWVRFHQEARNLLTTTEALSGRSDQSLIRLLHCLRSKKHVFSHIKLNYNLHLYQERYTNRPSSSRNERELLFNAEAVGNHCVGSRHRSPAHFPRA